MTPYVTLGDTIEFYVWLRQAGPVGCPLLVLFL
jgi:hypothetical protein